MKLTHQGYELFIDKKCYIKLFLYPMESNNITSIQIVCIFQELLSYLRIKILKYKTLIMCLVNLHML